jgi:hypothetical protein
MELLDFRRWVSIMFLREQLAKSYGHFRFLMMTNRTFLLWYVRIIFPILALLSLGLFAIVLLSAF